MLKDVPVKTLNVISPLLNERELNEPLLSPSKLKVVAPLNSELFASNTVVGIAKAWLATASSKQVVSALVNRVNMLFPLITG